MADLSDNTNWSELDASNNKNSPNGWPEGMMPSGVNDSARNDKGALKRFWDRANPVQAIAPASGVWTFTTGNPAYPTAYVDGEIYSFKASAASAGGDQFQVNTLGAKPIQKLSGGSWVAVATGDIAAALYPRLIYSAALNAGAGAFALSNPYVPSQGDGAGGISVPGNISATGNISAGNISATGTLTPTGGIIGSTNGSNAGAGLVGEFLFAINGTGTALGATVPTNITSLTLSAGDWDVYGEIWFSVALATTRLTGCLNTVSATNITVPVIGASIVLSEVTGADVGADIMALAPIRLNPTGNQTVYLIGTCSSAGATGYGKITARRVR